MQTVQNGLNALGFKTTLKAVPQQTMYSKFCGYVKAHVNVINNSNWSVLNDPKVNQAIDSAAAIADPAARYRAFASADNLIVDDAAAIPEIWSDNALLEGSKVKGVLDPWNDDWNLSFSSPS